MKQVLQNMRDGKTVVEEVPQPEPKPGMVLVQVAASLVSAGTERMLVNFAGKSLMGKVRARPDLARQVVDKARREGVLTALDSAFNRLDQPMVLGYSTAGRVTAVGNGVTGFRPGDRVACAGQHAVHAEYNLMPVNQVARIPENVTFESAAFGTLGAIALNGFRLASPQIGEKIAVIGLGLLGMITVQITQAAGCFTFGIDIDPRRVKLAHSLGVKASLRDNAEQAGKTFTSGKGFDAVLICADNPTSDTVELAASLARDRGHVISIGNVGLNLPRKPYYEKELFFQVSRSSGPGRYDLDYEEKGLDYPFGYVRWTEGRNLQAFLDLLGSDRIDISPLITHRFPIVEAPLAYDLITKSTEPALGVILFYPFEKTEIPQAAEPDMEMKSPLLLDSNTIGLGVLGAGNYASAVFLPILKNTRDIQRIVITSASGASAQHAAKKFDFLYASANEDDVFDNPQVAAVVILTRHNEHARQTIQALHSGKNVYCEKPLAIKPTELTAVWKALPTKSPPFLMVGYNRRFAPFAVRMQSFFMNRSEPMALHYRINAGAIPLNHWTQDPNIGGGRIIGEGCHFIDFLTFLIGQYPISVQAFALPDMGSSYQDNMQILLTYADGSVGSIQYLSNGDKSLSKEYVEVFCEGKVAILNDFRSLKLIQNGKQENFRSWLKQDKGHKAAFEAFISAIRMGGVPPIPYDQLWSTSQASFAVLQSLESGKQLTLPLPPKHTQ